MSIPAAMKSSPSTGSAFPAHEHSGMHPIQIEGKATLYVSGMPEKIIETCEGELPGMKMFMYGWIDSERGASGRVSFPASDSENPAPRNERSLERKPRPYDDDMPKEGDGCADQDNGTGTFMLSLNVRDGDPKYLKLQASVRVRDPESRNKRNFNVAVSCADLTRMLQGQEETFIMTDQFMPGNYVDVSMRVTNACEYRNHLSHADDMEKPLITFGPSALDKIAAWNAIVERVSNELVQNLQKNQITMSAGTEAFRDGITWYVRLRCYNPRTPLCVFDWLFFARTVGNSGGARGIIPRHRTGTSSYNEDNPGPRWRQFCLCP